MSDTVLGAFGILLTVATLYLGHNLGRQIQVRVMERRIDAYSRLWTILEVSGPWRLETEHIIASSLAPSETARGPMLLPERQDLYDKMTRWYFSRGQGMLLGPITREIYLNAKYNMVCEDDCQLRLKPKLTWYEIGAFFRKEVDRDRLHGAMAMQQLSLLRAAMRHDLRVLDAEIYQKGLNRLDKAFLREAGAKLYKKPWRSSLGPIKRRFSQPATPTGGHV